MSTSTYYLFAIAFAVLAGIKPAIVFIRWYNERLTRKGAEQYQAKIQESFIQDVAVNHLPHLYDGMRLIAAKLDVELPDPPPIKWLPYDPSKK